MNTKELKPYFLLITYAAVLILVVSHFEWLISQVGWIISVTMPFIIGFIIAFTLNRPFLFVQKHLLRLLMKQKNAKPERAKSQAAVLSILLVYAALFFVVIKLVDSVVPELIATIQNFSTNVSTYVEDFTPVINNLFTTLRLDENVIALINTYWQDFITSIGSFFNAMLPALVSFSMGAATGIYNMFSGLIISIYLLMGKQKLILTFKKLLYAFLPTGWADYVVHVGRVANRSFGGFLTGQVIVSCIVGTLCFVGMSLLKMPYAMLSSVVVGVTNIIPYFGPIIGAVPGTVMLLLTNPIQAVWFVLLIVCIQQFDGNFMSPKIVGGSIGIEGVWVLFSILVGGSLFGIPGMIAGLPAFGVLYALLREKAHKQLIAKGRNPDCPETPPYPDSPGHVDDSISAVFGNADKKK